MSVDPLHKTLLANVAKWADALDPVDPYSDEEPRAPALRLGDLAKDAAGPFPVLVVAHREETHYQGGAVANPAFFETRRFDDALGLIDWLAELEIKHDVIDGPWHSTVEIHRLAHRSRIDEEGDYLSDELTRGEHASIDDRVKLKVAEMTEDQRRSDEVASQARRAAEAERTRKRELAKLAELKSKYEDAGSTL